MRKLFCIILVVAPLIFLSGCDEEKVTFAYDANGGKFRDNSIIKFEYWPDPNCYAAVSCGKDTDFARWCAGNYPIREGYLFLDWKSNVDGTGFSHSDVDISSSRSDVTFYAQWAPVSEGYTIHFNTKMPAVSVQSVTGVSPSAVIILPAAADITTGNHKLLGWYLEDYTRRSSHPGTIYTEYFKLPYYPLKNIHLDAAWHQPWEQYEGTCTIVFDPQEGILDDTSISLTQIPCGSEITLPSASKAGSSFVGWFSHYYSRTFIYPGKYPIITDITFYAVWE